MGRIARLSRYESIVLLQITTTENFVIIKLYGKHEHERILCAMVFLFILDIMGLISKFGFNLIGYLEKIPVLIGVPIVVMIIVHFIPEEADDYYEENPALFIAIYIIEGVFLFVFMLPGHFEIPR